MPAPSGQSHNRTWSGNQSSPAVWDKPGSYQGNGWGVLLPQSAGNSQVNAASVQGSGVQLHHLTAQHGFQCFSIKHPAGQMISDILLDGCHAIGAGVPGSPHGSGGQGYYVEHVSRFVMQDCSCQDPAGHGIYLAETVQTFRLIRLNFNSANEHSQLFQLNSEAGNGIFDGIIDGCLFFVRDQSTGCANFLGAGRQDQPILVKNTHFKGGRQQSVSVDRSPGNNRPCFVTMQDSSVDQTVFVGPGCFLWLTGSSRNIRTSGPGKVVKA
jgi:hypothetical protein